MKVALELQPCCGKRSGIGVYTYELAKRMRDRDGLEFCGNLFNFLGRNDNAAALEGISIPIRENRVIPYGVYRRIWNRLPIPYSVFFPEAADLSIFFNFIVPPRIEGRVATVVHDLTYLRFPETVNAKNLHRIQRDIQYSMERSDQVITVSEFSKRELMELLGIPADKITVVYNAPSLAVQAADFAACAEKFHLRRPYLLYVGTIEPRKNLARLLKAFAYLKREEGILHQLVLAGGRGWANEEIYEAADSMEDVVFTGYLSEEEKCVLYENAEAFAFPSLYEGFGIPPLEAMALGCPVVCTGVSSLPEVVGDAAELVDPLDEIAIAQGIWNVISNPARAEELRQHGYGQAKKYTWTASADKLTDVCKTVLGAS